MSSYETLDGRAVAAENVERQSLTDKLLGQDPDNGRWVEVRAKEDAPPKPPNGGAPDVDGARLLDEVAATFRRFVVFPSPACCDAATPWTAHAHALEAFESTPRLAYISPEKGSGRHARSRSMKDWCPIPCMR